LLEFATPVSHLFRDSSVGQRISDASDCLECRDRTFKLQTPAQRLFHSDLQPIHAWQDKQFEYFKQVAATKPELAFATFHVASSCDHPVLEGKMWQPGGRTYSRREMLDRARENFARLRSIFGPRVQLAVENNNFYPTPAYDIVCEPDFITELVRENDLLFLYDIAHSLVSVRNMRRDFDGYYRTLPIDRMIQVHVCAPGLDETGLAYDAHDLPTDEILDILKRVIRETPVRFVTVEYYKDANRLVAYLQYLREQLQPSRNVSHVTS